MCGRGGEAREQTIADVAARGHEHIPVRCADDVDVSPASGGAGGNNYRPRNLSADSPRWLIPCLYCSKSKSRFLPIAPTK